MQTIAERTKSPEEIAPLKGQDLLATIHSPTDVKALSVEQLPDLAEAIREFLIDSVSKTGGHLAPNLGTVELTIALHRVFNSLEDKIVWDVGAQAYPHKILTGRREQFHTLRKFHGISGFPRRSESPHDHFGTGHSSTSISVALGMALARDLKGETCNVMAVIGDGGLTGGVALEGLNHAGRLDTNFLVILNDNAMAISPNLGGWASYLNRIITGQVYNRFSQELEKILLRIPAIGEWVQKGALKLAEVCKGLMIPGLLFEELGFRYFGPIDGHDLKALVDTFENVRQLKGPILVHVLTEKGRGYKPAESDPTTYHGLSAFDRVTGQIVKRPGWTYTSVFGKTVCRMAEKNPDVTAITAAMAPGTGLVEFSERFPERFFDVAIAEQHAVDLAAGLAVNGKRPVVAIYSTFLQRAFDQVYHDVCIENLPVIFAMDRAGVIGADGATHQGLYDIAFLRSMPNMVLCAPSNERELVQMLWTGLAHNGPFAVRYPRIFGTGVAWEPEEPPLPIGKGDVLHEGTRLAILALGTMVEFARETAALLASSGLDPTVVNMRFVKPLDRDLLRQLAQTHTHFVTYEDHVLDGGFGGAVCEALEDEGLHDISVMRLGLPDRVIEHGSREEIFGEYGLLPSQVAPRVSRFVLNARFAY
ncbi:MAG TPA: 1-deoxy-D-xylulose-5-phosphate synthase [bacterium]|nr:1-deoxy-D-xylulose-5-phosphate synthase [bacterium]